MTRYKFKGYTITNCGYHQPDHCVWWEACNDDGQACFHGTTLREVEFLILESEWEDKLKKKNVEVAELRECLAEAVCERCERMCVSTALTTRNETIRKFCDNQCKYRKWRKALEGANGESENH